MSGINAHAIIAAPAGGAAGVAAAELGPAAWQHSLRCFVEVLVLLHPLLGAATKVGCQHYSPAASLICMPGLCAQPPFALPNNQSTLPAFLWPTHLRLQTKQQLAFRLALGRPALSFLWDHQVQSAPIMPGAAYFEMAAAASRTLLRLAEPVVALTGAAIAAPLKLPAAELAASVVVSAEVALLSGDISIRSVAADSPSKASGKAGNKKTAAAETLHLRGSLAVVRAGATAAAELAAASSSPSLSADAVRAACRQPQDVAAVYRGLHAAGLQYGPAFRQLRGIQQGDSSAAAALGSCSRQEQRDADVSGFLMHPAMLDSCLQLGALVHEPAGTDSAAVAAAAGGAYVPAGLAAYLIQQPAQQGRGAQAVVRRSPEAQRKAAGATYRDHTLLASSGAVLAVLDGLEAKQLHGGSGARSATAAAKQQQQEEVLYEVAWQATTAAATTSAGPIANAANANATALALASGSELAAAGSSLLVLRSALQQQATAVQLQTVADIAPSGIANVGFSAAGGNALWGMLRSFAQEAPGVSHGGSRTDPLAAGSRATGSASAIVLAGSGAASEAAADGYGSLVQAGTALHAVLLPSSSVRAAAAPYHLMPKPRGAFG
jgi:hypothetical protein